ncbi:hypothetical protein, partial [Escherichia coli]
FRYVVFLFINKFCTIKYLIVVLIPFSLWFVAGLNLQSDRRSVISMGRENEEEDSPYRAIEVHGFF